TILAASPTLTAQSADDTAGRSSRPTSGAVGARLSIDLGTARGASLGTGARTAREGSVATGGCAPPGPSRITAGREIGAAAAARSMASDVVTPAGGAGSRIRGSFGPGGVRP